MQAVTFILSLARKLLAKESKGITTIPNRMAVEQKAGEIANTLQNAGLPLNRADEFIKSEQDLVRILNMIESTPPVMKEVPSGIRSTKSAKVFDMKGREIKNTKNIMGGEEVKETEAQIKRRLEKGNKEAAKNLRMKKIVDDAIDNMSPSLSGDTRTDAALVAEDMAESMGKVYDDLSQMERLDLYDQAYTGLSKIRFKGFKKPKDSDPEDMAQGGIARLGLKKGSGMTRRTFLKLLGGMAAVPIVGKFFKLAKVGQKVKQVPVIKTDDVAGKPEWFDALVNKVITEGDDVTKKFATGERQSIHQKILDDGSVVRVTEDVDDGAVRVEYESVDNMYEDPVQLQYKKPLPDEGDPRPTAEFTTAESGPVGRAFGPDDYEIEIDEVGGTSISDLTSDVSKLKEYATGKKPTLKEFVESKKRKDRAKAISEGGENEMDEVVRRQGEYVQFDDIYPEQDFASGGIARMLGE